jgi:hypothetical protein
MPRDPDRLPDAIAEALPPARNSDAAALDRLARAVRGLIREAAGEADILRDAAAKATATRAAINASTVEIEAKLTRFAGLIPVIEERLKEVESLLAASASFAARVGDDLDGRIAAAIRDHLRSHLLRDIQPQIERLIAARLDGFLTDFGALTFPDHRKAA